MSAKFAIFCAVCFVPAGFLTGSNRHETRTLLESASGSAARAEYLSPEKVEGNWTAEVKITSAGDLAQAAFLFAIQPHSESRLALHLFESRTELVRESRTESKALSSYPGAGSLPWRLAVRRRGPYFLFAVNGKYLGFSFHPSADVGSLRSTKTTHEPRSTQLGLLFPSPGRHAFGKLTVHPLTFGTKIDGPVIVPGARGSWNGPEAFPGAVINVNGTYYLYLNGTD